jgi:membrane protein DedA with SNARE-associated domain
MIDWIKNTMDAMGYPGIALLMFLENVFPPVPSELIMPLAGFTASQGKLTLWGVILAG